MHVSGASTPSLSTKVYNNAILNEDNKRRYIECPVASDKYHSGSAGKYGSVLNLKM